MKTLELSNIGWPETYIRQEPDMAHVEDLRDVIKGSEKGYPFDDPIMVRQLDKPAKYKMTMAGKAGTCEYELSKGLHRCLALQIQRVKTVAADVQKFSKPDLAFFAQYDDHGVLKVSVSDRAHFIKVLRAEYKWTVEQVAEKMGISTASVSRIARNLQGASEGKAKKGKGRKKKGAAAEPVQMFNPSEWFNILAELVSAYQEPTQKAGILGFVKTVDPKTWPVVEAMLTDLVAAADAA